MRRLQLLFFFLLGSVATSISAPANAQSAPDFERSGTFSVALANTRLAARFGKLAPNPFTRPLQLFKIRYPSTDSRGKRLTLSALLAIPEGGATRGLILWHHGTFSERALSPSLFKPLSRRSETESALLAFGSGGYAIAMPDYLGYGADKGAHPYPLSEINSKSALDLIAPCRAVAAKLKTKIAAPIFVTGYSEGGAVAMWTARRLQERGQKARAVALLSGPYDLSGVTRQTLLSTPPNAGIFVARLYLLAFTGYSWSQDRNQKLTNFFVPAMARAIEKSFGSGAPDQDIITRLATTAFFLNARSSMQNVLNPSFYRAITTGDARNPLVAALRQNDAFRFSPQSPTVLWALEDDSIVPAQNTKVALSEFRRRGVSSRIVRAELSKNTEINHITGLVTSLDFTRRFFDGIR